MSVIIKAENLGKKYIIGHQKQLRYQTLRDSITHTARGLLQRVCHPFSPNKEMTELEELWALKDINFEVRQGERIGIIGRNGAGKSTLLKVLSRITEPTTGIVRLKGRVSSLLEVGTGFHPELTGRENIFLNGAILGMTRQEIKRKFDEIVDFAEIEKFLDTPVKRYSSGMYVRLAFAVAAHLEPEILIVDEVLAVGDAAFQKKCLGKMENVAQEGRTVLFVSHNMSAIKALCSRTIVFDNGINIMDTESSAAIEFYLDNTSEEITKKPLIERSDRKGSGEARIINAWVGSKEKNSLDKLALDIGGISITLKIQSTKKMKLAKVGISINNSFNQCIIGIDSASMVDDILLKEGINDIRCSLSPDFFLTQGKYFINILLLGFLGPIDWVRNASSFEVIDGDFFGNGRVFNINQQVWVKQDWEINGIEITS